MVDCKQCPPGGTQSWPPSAWHIIESVSYNPKVCVGDRYTVKVITSREWAASSYQRVCLSEGGKLIGETGSIKIDSDELIESVFTGIMPDRDLNLHVSLQAESFGFLEECKDGKIFTIRLAGAGETTEQPIDPDNPDIPDGEDPFWRPYIDFESELMEYLPYVAIGISVLILIVIIKRK